MHKGKGTQVLNNAQVEELRTRRKIMHALVERTTEELSSVNIPASEFFAASLAYTAGACPEHETAYFVHRM